WPRSTKHEFIWLNAATFKSIRQLGWPATVGTVPAHGGALAMSTATGSPTRKQLDELEELLQRMLSLPVNPADATTPAPERTLAKPTAGTYPATFSITTDALPTGSPHSAVASTPPPAPIVTSPLPRAIPMRPAPPPPAPTAHPMPPVRRLD